MDKVEIALAKSVVVPPVVGVVVPATLSELQVSVPAPVNAARVLTAAPFWSVTAPLTLSVRPELTETVARLAELLLKVRVAADSLFVTVMDMPALITTSSPAPGTRLGLQMADDSQLPLLVHVTVAARMFHMCIIASAMRRDLALERRLVRRRGAAGAKDLTFCCHFFID